MQFTFSWETMRSHGRTWQQVSVSVLIRPRPRTPPADPAQVQLTLTWSCLPETHSQTYSHLAIIMNVFRLLSTFLQTLLNKNEIWFVWRVLMTDYYFCLHWAVFIQSDLAFIHDIFCPSDFILLLFLFIMFQSWLLSLWA